MAKEDENRNEELMFGPLRFPDSTSHQSKDYLGLFQEYSVPCILCKTQFKIPSEKSFFLVHLLDEHKLIIADVEKIAGLKGYCDYWRRRFSLQHMSNFCSIIIYKDENGEKKDEYFLLSDAIKEDKLIREGLQKKRLEWVLDIQARERSTPINRSCIFCREQFEGLRSDYFNHLYGRHNFHLGSPENLVFTDELLDGLENTMERTQCLFCEGIFSDRSVLKEHMRKKQHKRVNPDNKKFDRYYIINYLEMGKTWQDIQGELDECDYSDDKSDWSDWEDDNIEPYTFCLFCDFDSQKFEEILRHMLKKHGFNFQDSCEKYYLNFYLQVKLVNFIRLRVYNVQCINCSEAFTVKNDLLEHMTRKQHFEVPDRKLWDQPEFYFPTYENDTFLCYLDDVPENCLTPAVNSGPSERPLKNSPVEEAGKKGLTEYAGMNDPTEARKTDPSEEMGEDDQTEKVGKKGPAENVVKSYPTKEADNNDPAEKTVKNGPIKEKENDPTKEEKNSPTKEEENGPAKEEGKNGPTKEKGKNIPIKEEGKNDPTKEEGKNDPTKVQENY